MVPAQAIFKLQNKQSKDTQGREHIDTVNMLNIGEEGQSVKKKKKKRERCTVPVR